MTKDDVVDEATRLFAERGYEGLSMADLAARVGLRKASLFHHFPTKEAVYARVIEVLVDELAELVVAAGTPSGAFAERVMALNDALTEAFGKHPYAARLLVREAMDEGPGVPRSVRDKIDRVLDAARALVVEGQRAGECDRELDPTHVVVSILGMQLMPFSLGGFLTRFVGQEANHPAFVSARAVAVREQVRRILALHARR